MEDTGGKAAAPVASATVLDALTPERRLLLRRMLRERALSQRIPRREGNGPAPLSFAQQRLWFIHQLDPESQAYNMPARRRLRGPLDVRALRRSLGELVRRHEAVRTTLVEPAGGGEAMQVVRPPAPVPFPVVDVSRLPPEARVPEARRRVEEEAARPFDLVRGPLLRALLVRMDADDWATCFTTHHVVSDGWSLNVLTREVSALYGAFSRGEPSPLPELEIQYADFAAWQRRWLSGEVLDRQLDFWRDRLGGAPALLELPTDHPRRSPVGVSEKGVAVVLSPGTTQALRDLARAEGATLFMTLLAAWQTLLGRYAGQDDVVVGTPIANRTRAELEPLIGFFVNTLVLRTDLSGDPTFGELLARVREGTLGAFAHQDLPFERLVEELAPERSLLHNPLFQVMFALQNNERGSLELGEVEVEPFGGGDSGAKFDIGATLWDQGDRVTGELTYREDLFEPATMRRMAEHFRLLLEEVAADPARPVSTLRLVTPAEERQLVAGWNPPRSYPSDLTVPGLFADQARRTPGAHAVAGPGGPLTYAELDARSGHVARALRALGAGPETPVGVCLERGPELLTAVLGCWKAGAAYLPLDPEYPADRLAYMLRDAAVPVLLSDTRTAAALPPHDAAVLLLDADAELVDRESPEAPAVNVDPDTLAYVIYTSGSTGRPKGVRVPHRALLHTLGAALDVFRFGGDDVMPSLASFAFDIWIFEAVLPLLAGGCVRVVPRDEVLATDRLPDRLEDATALHAVPALMRQLAQVLRAGGRVLPRLRQAFVGGDAVAPELLEEMREVFPAASLHVLYGPTEGTVICAAHTVREGEPRRRWVGRPLGNAALYVLDRALQPVPVGVPGELCIGGASAARDYLGRPDATAERWSPDPFAAAPGARLYRTGDRVRWTAAGELEFLGRVDAQVKIRGFRIEPGEIESVLAEHPGVRDAVVLVREDVPGEKRLVGYVVPAEEAPGAAPRGELQQEHVGEWESLFGDTYSGDAADEDPAFNVVGWNSSYTGEPVPAEEMRAWVEAAAGSLRALRPRRVLEIGCGTGLLLFRVAPECDEYWGTDFAAPALESLRRAVSRPGRELPQVTLLERAAEDFTGIPAGHFDLVVINSVAQYFPGVDYLLRVLEGAVDALAPGGALWVGDVRSLPLLEAFHASVELARAEGDAPAAALRAGVRRRVAREKELLLDPELFRALPARLPRVSRVEIRLKAGAHANEMTRFRYDVLLRVDAAAPPPPADRVRWDDGSTLDAVARRLEREAPESLVLAQIPDARVAGALGLLEALAADGEARTAEELRALAAEREAAAVDPEAVRALAQARGYRAHLRPSPRGAPGRFDVLLARAGSDAVLAEAGLAEEAPASPLPPGAYASDPLARLRGSWLLPELRAKLRDSLPEYMVPGALVLLERLPLTPSGKVDRRALPAPEAAGPDGSYRAPRNPTEEALAQIWAAVLQVERVGVEDDFFALGGHSLLATRVVSRIREALAVEVPLRAVFEAPTVGGLAARVDALLRAGTGVQLPPLRPAPRDGSPLPLSFAQQRLWFIHQLDPRSPAYNMPFPLRLRGGLEPAALARALTELARRHESLRTVFHAVEGEPVQVVLPAGPVALPVVDLRGLADEDREAALLRLAREEATRPFDLARGPLLRSTLLRPGDEEWAVLFTLHHVVSDGWSMGVLVREMSSLYEAFLGGRPSPLPEPALQYADYAVWQRGWLAGETLEAQLAYWREALGGAPPLLELPTDRPRPLVASDRAGQRAFALSVEASQALRALSHREGATPFMTMLAVYAALLARWSGQDDVSVGTPLAGRGHLELEGLIGFFVGTLVIRTRLDGRPGFRRLLGRVREATLGAQAHQDLPFERLVDELEAERSLDYAPLFQAMFALNSAAQSDERLSLGGVRVYPLHAGGTTAKWDLSLSLEDGGERMVGSVVYRADLFDADTVERMLGHFRVLAERFAEDPDRPVAEVDLLTPAERAELLDADQSRRGYPAGGVHALFAAQAQRTPGAVALRFAGEETTYAELEARANRLAHLLRRRGVGPEVAVGICLPRTPEMVVALLAVLGAGGAYLPLDPAYPAERLGYMLEDAGARLVVTDAALTGRLPARAEAVVLDALREELAREGGEAPESGVLPDNLSHVIFTSGSTGRPKGVMIRHSSVVTLLHWLRDNVSDEERGAVLASTSINFDVSVAEIFGTLCWGGTLYLVENALELARFADRERIRYASMVPTAAAELLRMGALPAGVRTLNLGGEALPATLARELYALGTVEKVGNLYGPTEDTTYSTYAVVPREAGRVTVGRPVANTRARVLDAELGLVPVGVVGELYLAGDGLARGYAGRPDLTAERFVPDPFGEPGGRMYRVMDRVRRLADGELEYLGRTDFQVKVRGFRIEPGEIESVLRTHPGVGAAVVVAREDSPGERRLVAYVAADGEPPSAEALRERLRASLPEHMVPSAFVVLHELPLTPNGKVDRGALPAPKAAGPDGAYRAPRTPTEEALAEIWAAVLQVERVGVEDDFFTLGGHSLLATRMVSRIREALEVEVPVRALFEAPTVAGLAARVDDLLRAAAGVQLPPLRPAPRDGSPLPLSFAQQRLWFIHQLDPRSPAYNMPFPLRLRGGLEPAALARALTELARRHESLRTVFHAVEGEPVQVVLPAGPVALPVVDLRGLADEDREAALLRLAREEATRPFDLARGPLLRSTLLRPGDEEWAVLFTLHHVVSDGWSMGVLVREMSSLYEAFLGGRPSPLPEPALQYADYAVWQRGWLAGETLEAQLAYWREALGGAPPLLELPTDRPRPLVASDRAGQRAFALSVEASQALRALSHREGATPFMTMLAVYAALLARWSGQDDVSVGTPLAGRGHLELEGLIGFFVGTLVIRTRLDGRPGFRRLLGRVREATLGAQAHQDLPFERLVDELEAERSLDYAPLFQAMFALNSAAQSDERLSLGGVRVYPLHAGGTTAKWDLSLSLEDGGERMVGSVVYRADLFEADTVERMLGHFRVLAERFAGDPDRPVAEVDLLTPAERAELLDADPERSGYPAGGVHELFAAQARRTPGAVALRFAGEETTYAELEARANRLAHLLRRRGVGPEVAVGICLPRTPEMVVALLAVLAAGGAYLPLDPAYPAERLGYMLEDAGARLVVTDAALTGRLPARAEAVVLDALREELAREGGEAPESGVLPDNLSHVIFTSGSTGRPKGVMIRHSSVVTLLHWLRDNVSDEERGAVLASTSINFDVSVAEIFGTLCWGGTLYLVENALELARFPDRERIRYASMVPTAAAELLRMGALPAGVRTLNLGGEALPAPLARELYALGTVERVGNLYGPTEDTTYSSYAVVPREAGRVTVGRPVANTRARVLDAELGLVPVGVVGELYLAGDGLARGYAGRPDLTAERFVPDPFGEPGGRMYRVMDRVRRLADGELEYLGRTDFQVKVRGFRIEPGEIESVLRTHPGVGAAVVVAREDAPGERRLVAYVAADGEPPSAEALRERLRASLPEHMVPSAFVVLHELPLTPNGKVDRGALPAPEQAGAPGAEHVPPRDAVELALAGVWEEVLGASPVGVRDNFFALGGHSLLAVRLMARIETVLGARLPLPTLFAAPTVEKLAALLRRESAGGEASPLVPIRASGERTPLFFVHPVGGDVLCYAPLARHLDARQPFYALRARGLDADALDPASASVDAMAADYLDALRAARPRGPYRLGGWSMGGVVAFEMARRLEAAGEAVDALVLVDSLAPALVGLAAPEDEATLVRTFAADLGVPLGELPPAEDGAGAADARGFLGRVLEAARGAGVVPPDIGFEQVWRLYGTFRANLRAMYEYRPGPYGGPVTLLRASEHGAAGAGTLGWESVAAGGVEVHTVPGSHFTLVREPNATELARVLSEVLESSGG